MDELTPEEKPAFKEATVCHICEKPIAPDDIKVRDHSHRTRKYSGPAHQDCNVNFQDWHAIPVVFHN